MAVNTLGLVGSNDDVLESGTVLDVEDGVGVTTLGLAGAGDTTAESLHATVKGTGDGHDLGELAGSRGGREARGSAGGASDGGSRSRGGGSAGEQSGSSTARDHEGLGASSQSGNSHGEGADGVLHFGMKEGVDN